MTEIEKNSVTERVKILLLNNGVISDLDDKEELLFDSIEFVSFIVDVEEEFEICIPDDYLDQKKLNSIKAITRIIENLVNAQYK